MSGVVRSASCFGNSFVVLRIIVLDALLKICFEEYARSVSPVVPENAAIQSVRLTARIDEH